MRYLNFIIIVFFILITSCEEEFVPDEATSEEQIVVEGYIEDGPEAAPPYVFLTRTASFFSEFSPNQLEGLFISGAEVFVKTGETEFQLTELCLADLPAELQETAAEFLGFNPDSLAVNICVYIDLSFEIPVEQGRQYDLRIEAEGKTLTATTLIPPVVPMDSCYFTTAPSADSLAELRCFISDPSAQTDYYRYFTSVEDQPFYPGFNSIIDDAFFNGLSFEFPVPRGQLRTQELDPATFGYFVKGDSIRVKFGNIDQAQYDFWNTLEYNAQSQGPFASYTRVASNIEGGIGIWGGISYTLKGMRVEVR